MFEGLLLEVENKAAQDKAYRFHNCVRWLTADSLSACWLSIREHQLREVNSAVAVQYDKHLHTHISLLEQEIALHKFIPDIGYGVFIPKVGGENRLLARLSINDMILQLAVSKILYAIYKYEFLPNCHGFRPGIGAHQPIKALTAELRTGHYKMLVEADIKSFVKSVDHSLLIDMLGKRIADQAFLNLVQKWLTAGVYMADGKTMSMLSGLRNGEYITCILSSIYLHYALDIWLKDYARNYCHGAVYFCRYSNDVGVACENADDAEQLFHALSARLARFSLSSQAKLRLWSLDELNAGSWRTSH